MRNVSICANLSSTEGSILTPRGMLSASWTCGGSATPDSSSGLCGKVAEKENLKLSCSSLGGGTIKAIKFASFGTPTGSCTEGFKTTATCDSAGALAKIQTACVGKASCSIPASTQYFGHDPCFDVVKSLAISATGCNGAPAPPPGPPKSRVFTYNVVVPVGSTAQVFLPKMGHSSVLVTEALRSPQSHTVFQGGAFVKGAPGITGAVDRGHDVVVDIGSGAYNFVVLA